MNMERGFSNFPMGKKIILLLLILTVFFYGCVSDPERLMPPEDCKTGLAHYLTIPIDTSKLGAEGYTSERGWNIFVWPEDQNYDTVKVKDVLESIKGSYYYVYNYNEKTFYFPPEGKYAKLREHRYYSKRFFDIFFE